MDKQMLATYQWLCDRDAAESRAAVATIQKYIELKNKK